METNDVNVDYKIFTKVLAKRLQKVIKYLLNESQSGFIKGRQISTHIRLLEDVTRYVDNENMDGLIVSLDYQKAFESVNKETILSALKLFNFGPKFLNFVNVILIYTQSAVNNGGWLTKCFNTERGVRQGCCKSPLLFVMVVEMLAIKLRNDDGIKGILKEGPVRDELKLLQYADDMTLLVKDEAVLKQAFTVIEEFSKISELKLNSKKAIGMWVGGSNNNESRGEGITWVEKGKNVKVLGIYFNASEEAKLD